MYSTSYFGSKSGFMLNLNSNTTHRFHVRSRPQNGDTYNQRKRAILKGYKNNQSEPENKKG